MRPAQSTPVAFGSRESSTWVTAMNTAIAPMGTLTKKIHFQPKADVITPPSTGPTATAAPVTAPNTPKAVPRSLPWKAWPIRASEVANIIAPPVPCTARAMLSISGVVDRPQAAEAHALSTDQVRHRAGGQKECCERQRVGVYHPLQVREGGVQRALDVG